MKNIFLILIITLFFSCIQSNNSGNQQKDTSQLMEAPKMDVSDTSGGKGVFFVNIKDSDEVKSPLLVKMGVKGMEVEVGGAANDFKGHHHIIVDGQAVLKDETVPLDDTHLHFGQGQTEAELKLDLGYHTITLQFANGLHSSYGPRWSKTIRVRVK